MRTLFRLLLVTGILVGIGRTAMWPTATYLKPHPREIVRDVPLPPKRT